MAPGDWVVGKAGVTGELSDEKKHPCKQARKSHLGRPEPPSRQTRTARAQIQRREAA